MKAIIVANDADHSLCWQEVPDPTCSPGEVLVDIHATAVNRADLLQRAGNYPPPPGASPYMGLEMAGVVAATEETVTQWQPGDRVLGLLSGGGYAERVAVPATHLLPLPAERDFIWGAAICEVFLTAFVNLFREAGLRAGETALIHGGGSGVGTAAVQLCHQADAKAIVTAGTDAKVACCLALGAEFGVNYKERDFAEAILAHTDGVDVILDIAGADYLARNVQLLKSRGPPCDHRRLDWCRGSDRPLGIAEKAAAPDRLGFAQPLGRGENRDHRGLQRAFLAAANRRAHESCDRGRAAY